MKKIRIGTRKSRLACIQAQMLADYIEKYCEGYEAELVTVMTTGDRIQTKRLDEIGGKGLFVKELDTFLLEGRTDLSVHSLKDMPMEISPEIPIIGFSRREDARDVLVLPRGITEYDYQGPVGCSSNRRSLQLKDIYPEVQIKTIRGNVLTRLDKLDQGEYGGLILAAAGLKRLGLSGRISRYFTVNEMVPAAGQGVLCVQGRAGEDYGFLRGFFDEEIRECVAAERAYMAYLNGGCSLPMGVYANILDETRIQVLGLYYDEEKGRYGKWHVSGKRSEAEALGISLAQELKESVKGV